MQLSVFNVLHCPYANASHVYYIVLLRPLTVDYFDYLHKNSMLMYLQATTK